MNNKGFTLVEIVVAVILSTFASAAMVLILRMCFTNYKSINLESQTQIENQVVTEQMKRVLSGCDSYESFYKNGYNIIEIHSYDEVCDDYVFYNYIVLDNKCYVKVTETSLKDERIADVSSFDYLANHVESISLFPSSFHSETASVFDTNVEIKMGAYGEVSYESSFVVHIKANN